MAGAFYPRLALLLQFISFPTIYVGTSTALPATLPYQTPTNTSVIGQTIQTLLDTLSADPDPFHRDSQMVDCSIAVDFGDHDPEEFHEYPYSSNISEFRDMRCIFRDGGPVLDPRLALFWVENRWPRHWGQWGPPSDTFPSYFPVFPFSGRETLGYMSAERADRLLKAHGIRGRYQLVSLSKRAAEENETWRILNVEVPDSEGGGQRTFKVDVRTGRIEMERGSSGILRNVTGVFPAADYQ